MSKTRVATKAAAGKPKPRGMRVCVYVVSQTEAYGDQRDVCGVFVDKSKAEACERRARRHQENVGGYVDWYKFTIIIPNAKRVTK